VLPCVILAGGLGTRQRPLTDRIPKSLIPVNGRPFAEIQLEWLRSEGVQHVVLCVGYRADMIMRALGPGDRFGMEITYVDEGDRLLGTGGALRLALDRRALPDAFFVLNGDSYLRVKLADVEDAWCAGDRPVLMVVHRNENRWDLSNAAFDGRLVRYDKRQSDGARMDWIDYGLCVLSSDTVAVHIPSGEVVDLSDVMGQLSSRGMVAGFEARERFYEVGSHDGLRDLEAYLASAR